MDTILSIFKKYFSDIFRQGEKLSIRQITKKNLPYFISWIAIILWVDCYTLPIGEVNQIHHSFKIAPASIFSYLYPIATTAVICLFDVRKLLPYVKFSASVAMIGILSGIILGSSPGSYIVIVLAAIGFGHIVASANYGFFMILNNSEKLYSVSIGILLSKMILLLKAYFASSLASDNFFGIMQVLGFVPVFICTLFYRGADSYEPLEPEGKMLIKDCTVLILAFVVLIFNDFLAPTLWRSFTTIPPLTLNTYHAAGVFLGIIFTILLQQVLQCNICYVLNFSLAILTLGFVINVPVYLSGKIFLFSAFTFGISYAMGFISLYYMMGIILKKSCSLTLYRIGMLSVSLFYVFGFSVIKVLRDINSQSIFSITALLSAAVLLMIFALTPFFTKILYFAEWTDDLHRPDVTHVSRLTAHLSKFKLSPREIEVCALLLDGYTMRQISAMLSITYSTVNTYCTSIYRKLGINSKTELVVMFSQYLSK